MRIHETIHGVLNRELSPYHGLPYALIDFPNYLNPGDSAIWCGSRHILEAVLGRPPSYVASLKNFRAAHCKAAISGGPVFFLGGGNFGDLYEKHNRYRNRVLSAMPDNPVVFLPMSVANKSANAALPDQQIAPQMFQHQHAVFFAREVRTKAFLKARFDISAVLCPDLGHFVEPLERYNPQGQIILLRKDPETAQLERGTEAFDWSDIRALRLTNKFGKLAEFVPSGGWRLRVYDQLALRKTVLAMQSMHTARSILTDRLHAMILASNMGLEIEIIDNLTGKISSYCATWYDDLPEIGLRQNAGSH